MPAVVRPSEDKFNRKGVAPQRRRKTSGQFTVVESISRPAPSWLPLVMTMRKVTTPLAVTSLAGVLLFYGITVVTQREWGTQFSKLDSLQAQQNALITQVEKTKYRIPRELEIEPKNFVDLNQKNTLFVQPDAVRPEKAEPAPRPHSLLRDDRMPVGY